MEEIVGWLGLRRENLGAQKVHATSSELWQEPPRSFGRQADASVASRRNEPTGRDKVSHPALGQGQKFVGLAVRSRRLEQTTANLNGGKIPLLQFRAVRLCMVYLVGRLAEQTFDKQDIRCSP